MSNRRAVAVATSLGGFVTAALVASSAPPARADVILDCAGGPSIDCLLTVNGGTNEQWYVNGQYNPAWDNQDLIYFRCSRGTWVGIYVTYTGDEGNGAVGTSVYCG